MKGRSINNKSDIATEVENTADVTTPILEIEPEDGTMITLKNNVPTGTGTGLPIFADLRDSNDNQISTQTEIVFRVVKPTDDTPTAVSVREDNIAAINQLTVSEQRDSDNIDSVKLELQGARINVRDRDVLRVELEGPDQIDWSNSEFYIPRQGVEEKPFSG